MEFAENIIFETVYRYIGDDSINGIFSSGFMKKTHEKKTQINFSIPYYSCLIILSGSGKYTDEKGREHMLCAGSIVQRIPDLTHSTYIDIDEDNPWVEFYVSFGRSTFYSLKSMQLLTDKTPVISLPMATVQSKYWITRFKRLLEDIKNADENELFSMFVLAQQTLISLHQLANKPHSGIISQARMILSSNFAQNFSIEDVAKQLCVGHETFRKLFTQEVGISPKKFRIQKKLITSQMMIMNGVRTSDIALAMGYCDTFAFSKHFKKYTGISPSEYKKDPSQLTRLS